jgi:FtsZ-interacting cell division protein YlmF
VADSKPAVVAIRSFADVMQVGDEYRWHRPVDVSLRNADDDLAQRVLDFATGLAHVDGGTVIRLDEHRYRLTPGSGSTPGTADDREPRTPHPVAGAGSAVAPLPEEPMLVDAVSAHGLVHIDA